ncbi:MAG: hypothetical protein FWD19_04095 [Defluviitaleaceae bacterium]|nr:hypothetical protein [Defluviitaleaceae bacterium]
MKTKKIFLINTHKKFFFVFIFSFFIFCSCEKNFIENENFFSHEEIENDVLDFRSMRDTELDVIISLGDSKEKVIELLGELPEESYIGTEYTIFQFQNGMSISFENDEVAVIFARNIFGAEKFEIYDCAIGMSREQIAVDFEFNENISEVLSEWHDGTEYFYAKVFDSYGHHLGGVLHNANGKLRGTLWKSDGIIIPHENAAIGSYVRWRETPIQAGKILTVLSY